ncbi:ABC transporter ATP-binding protein [Ramlibacter henchirensis]|uniref:ABC transporter ATP-binding protein n=1 Tax=Ramlibacter henchirensis TaxID=204072 RepID=A0A4Z0BW47_9BURK|nr:ABC transporter ATP-binding protein [Ramlibacter henchirensis]TFZ02932.1 ABC transporter ATP-binding protein [Ramlibacter henchirensis]
MKNILEVRDLHAWYGESHVLHGVDLQVAEGETVTLLGTNGAGKTTTLKSILGLVPKRAGHIHFEGVDLLRLPMHKMASLGLGFVPEDRGIFPGLSVRENLQLPPVHGRAAFTDEELFELFPNLREREHAEGTTLSGGEQQMLAIARPLRSGVRLLMLDEPTEGLAPLIVERIGHVLRILKSKGITILLVEQNFRFAERLADRFYVMQHGRIADSFDAAGLDARRQSLYKLLSL